VLEEHHALAGGVRRLQSLEDQSLAPMPYVSTHRAATSQPCPTQAQSSQLSKQVTSASPHPCSQVKRPLSPTHIIALSHKQAARLQNNQNKDSDRLMRSWPAKQKQDHSEPPLVRPGAVQSYGRFNPSALRDDSVTALQLSNGQLVLC
jgi:hypothetical protein